MKIIIIGCGKVGEELAAVLSREGNDITVIDKRENVVERLCNKYDIMGYVGDGISHSVQTEAEVQTADLMIAVTGSDEINLLCCLIAKKVGDCQTIARVKNPEYSNELSFIKEELGLAMVINQEQISALEVSRVMKFPSAIKIDTFAKGRVELLRFKVPQDSVLDGMNMYDMHTRLKCNVLVCTVEHKGEIVIPKGDYVVHAGDVLSIVASPKDESLFFQKIGIKTNRVKDVIIIGGGDIAYYLAKYLISAGVEVKIIERDLERCEKLCEKIPKATIIHGDGANKELLDEEGIGRTEGFAALTNIDEENLILSLYAKQCGCRKVVTKINRIVFNDVIDSLDMDTTIYPRTLTADYILQYVRAMKNSMGSNVETVHRIIDHRAEALEFWIKEGFQRQNIPLQDLPIRSDVLISCIRRDGEIMLPRGKDVLMVNDTVIVVTTRTGLNDINDIFVK